MVRHRLSDESIRTALAAARGNVAVAARHLGIARNSLYKRIGHMKHELHAARARRRGVVHRTAYVMGHPGDTAATAEHVQESESAIYSSRDGVPTFMPVRDTLAARNTGTRGSDGRIAKSLSLRKDQADELARARRRLAVVLDVDLTDSALLERFIDDELENWIAKQLAPRRPPAEREK